MASTTDCIDYISTLVNTGNTLRDINNPEFQLTSMHDNAEKIIEILSKTSLKEVTPKQFLDLCKPYEENKQLSTIWVYTILSSLLAHEASNSLNGGSVLNQRYRCTRQALQSIVRYDQRRHPEEFEAVEQHCPVCGSRMYAPHDDGCPIAKCSVCGGDKIKCTCKDHDPTFYPWLGTLPGRFEAFSLDIVLYRAELKRLEPNMPLFNALQLDQLFFIRPSKNLQYNVKLLYELINRN